MEISLAMVGEMLSRNGVDTDSRHQIFLQERIHGTVGLISQDAVAGVRDHLAHDPGNAAQPQLSFSCRHS
jgi:hypothetical protein